MLGVAIVGGLQYALASQTMLNTFFSQTKTLQARFTQEVVDKPALFLTVRPVLYTCHDPESFGGITTPMSSVTRAVKSEVSK